MIDSPRRSEAVTHPPAVCPRHRRRKKQHKEEKKQEGGEVDAGKEDEFGAVSRLADCSSLSASVLFCLVAERELAPG